MRSDAQRSPANAPKPPGKTLAATVLAALRRQIANGKYAPGDRLPSEARLTGEFSVSRTVIREAIAALRADSIVESRQGAGIFVLPPSKRDLPPFSDVNPERISSMIEILELRTAVETEAAGLAAQRRSPAQEEALVEALREFNRLAKLEEDTAEADFRLHLAIAEATSNRRFPEFLSLIGPEAIPRRAVGAQGPAPELSGYAQALGAEHEAIVGAIIEGNEEAARAAMRAHLRGSQARYRNLLRLKA